VAISPCEQQRESTPYNDKGGLGYVRAQHGTDDKEELGEPISYAIKVQSKFRSLV
jgi:hypothetical protein